MVKTTNRVERSPGPGGLLLSLALTTRQSRVLLVIDVWHSEKCVYSIEVQYSPCERPWISAK